MANLILGPIVGGLTDTQAYVWGRADGPGTLNAWLGQKSDLSDAWLAGTSHPLLDQNGYAGVVPLDGLQPETSYYYTLGFEGAAPSPGIDNYPSFATFPIPGKPQSFSFVFGSCFLNIDESSSRIFDQINKLRIRRANDPRRALRFMLLLGDQIYADDYRANGLARIDPQTGKKEIRLALTLEDYRQVYANTWSNPVFRHTLTRLPAYMTLDDHEVDDDWIWKDFERQRADIPYWDRLRRKFKSRPEAERRLDKVRIQAALKAYWEHQGMHARGYIKLPELAQENYTLHADDQGSFAYTFTYGAAAFFVLDTRTRRVKKSRRERSMLGKEQWQALKSWLLKTKDLYPVKFIITSCTLLFRMWKDIPQDRWTGFPRERRRLLGFLAREEISGVYLLTGDMHSAHAISVELKSPGGKVIPLWELCSTPFNQEPNWMAKASYLPLTGDPIQNQQLHFVCAENNFGVVNVNFREHHRPQVNFELYRQGGSPPITLDTNI